MSLNREETLLAFCLLITKDLADTCADYDGSIPLPSFCRSDCGHLYRYHQAGEPDRLLCVRGPNALEWTAAWLDKVSCCPMDAQPDRQPGDGLNLRLLRTAA